MEEARLSPETDVVELRDCMEELLKFILQSHTTQTLGLDFDIGLSTDYCSTLLKEVDDFNPSASLSTGHLTGVPPYPLYRRLAMALTETICSGMLCKKYVKALLFDIDKSNLNQNGEFVELIQQKGTELLKKFKSINFQINVQEPFFTQLKDGHKTIEGRCATGDYNRIGTGAFLLVNKCLVLEVKDIRTYSSFSEMLEAECLSKVLPGVNSVEEGVQIYRRFYTEEKEMRNGVLAIDILRSFPQPYISLSQILSELGYSGVQSLLDLVCTAETISDMLPPPRALAKHFGGSSRRPGATLMATENDSEQQTQGEDLASNHSFYNA